MRKEAESTLSGSSLEFWEDMPKRVPRQLAQHKTEGIIDNVRPGSPAEGAGIRPGDRLISINGKPIRDVVGYRFHQAAPRARLQVVREGEDAPLEFVVRKPETEDLGLEFFEPTFDGIKRCNNHCPFCFVDQNAPGLRRSLDIKDDDVRYSFLYGGFITLTNLKESDWQRVDDERLSPLYVSVHATDPEMRRKLLGNPRAPEIIPQLRRLAGMGVRVHTQLVLCPGVNDGEYLDQSIRELAELYPHVQTVGIVPVGLTRYRQNSHYQIKLDIRSYTPAEARAVVAQVSRWQRKLSGAAGSRFAFLSDEWYLLSGKPVPSSAGYEGFPQYENGVGMVRQLLDESKRTAHRLPESVERPVRVVVACGEMPARTLETALAPLGQMRNVDLRLVPVKNESLGGNVGCSGLLFGAEVAAALRKYGASGELEADLIFLPRRMFDFSATRTLDEWTIDRFQQELGRPVIQAEWTREIWSGVRRLLRGDDCFTPSPSAVRFGQLG